MSFLWLGSFSGYAQEKNALSIEDVKQFGSGTAYLTDKTVIKKVTIHQINENWIVYEKEGSLHDLKMEEIKSITFNNCAICPKEIIFEEIKSDGNSVFFSIIVL